MTRAWRAAALISILVAAALICGAATEDDDGFFGPSVAAWVQALGAIAAMGVVIQLDRLAAERLRRDREAEWERQRADRVAAVNEARTARLNAIEYSIAVLNEIAKEIAESNMQPGEVGHPSWDVPMRLRSAQGALGYYLTQQSEMPTSLIGAVSLAYEKLADIIRVADTRPLFRELRDRDAYADGYRTHVRDFNGILARARAG